MSTEILGSEQVHHTCQAPSATGSFLLGPLPFVRGLGSFVRRLPALIPILLFLAIAWCGFGAGLNIPSVFWHGGSYGVNGIITGLCTTLLFFYLWLITLILDVRFEGSDTRELSCYGWLTRVLTKFFPRRTDTPDSLSIYSRVYLASSFLPCVLLLALSTFCKLTFSFPFIHLFETDLEGVSAKLIFLNRWHFLIGIIIGILGIFFALRLRSSFVTKIFRQTACIRSPLPNSSTASYSKWALRSLIFVAPGLIYCSGLLAVSFGHILLPPVLAIILLFGMIAGLLGLIWYWCHGKAVFAFIFIVAWLIVSNACAYKLRFPDLGPEYATLGTKEEIRLSDYESPAADWNAIHSDQRDSEWKRVSKLAQLRVSQLNEPNRQSKLEELNKLPKSGANAEDYQNLMQVWSGALTDLDSQEISNFRSWSDKLRVKTQKKPKLVVVTVTGGANRSALWTAHVLKELQRELPDFAQHVRLISGASGGMVGASYFVASLTESGLPKEFEPEDVAQDHLTPVVNSLVFQDVPFLFLPTHYSWDRGRALDLSLEGDSLGASDKARSRLRMAFTKNFAELKKGEDEGWRPSLVFTPMMVEDGRRLIISNRQLPFLTYSEGNRLYSDTRHFNSGAIASKQNAGTGQFAKIAKKDVVLVPVTSHHQEADGRIKAVTTYSQQIVSMPSLGNNDIYGRSALEFFHLFPNARGRFKLSTAARMNATFPIVSPAVSLPTNPPRRVVDAGYYDNYGVSVAAAWLERFQGCIAQYTSGVVVIQIRDTASNYDRRHLERLAEVEQHESSEIRRGSSPVAWLTGPLAAVDEARQSTASFRNDEMLARLDNYFKTTARRSDGPIDNKFFQTVIFERYTPVGMSWFLSDSDKKLITQSWAATLPNTHNNNPASLEQLKQWWNSR